MWKKYFLRINKLSTYKEIMIEKYIPGREIQVALWEKEN